MGFLSVDKDRLAKVGNIFVAKVDGKKVVIGRCKGSDKLSAILSVAADWAKGNKLPSIHIVKFKKVKDMYLSESFLHSYFMDYIDDSGDFYAIPDKVITNYWKEL